MLTKIQSFLHLQHIYTTTHVTTTHTLGVKSSHGYNGNHTYI